jgi:hypothetical protein
VQHCPGASRNPRDLCRLLQVSSACRTALQQIKGHWRVGAKCASLQKLRSYADWATANSSLVKSLAVDISYIEQPGRQLAAAIAALRKLTFFKLTGSQAFDRQVLAGLFAHTQLTYVHIDAAAADVIRCLPDSVVHLRLAFDLSTEEKSTGFTARAAVLPCLSFRRFTALQSLSVDLWADPVQDDPWTDPRPEGPYAQVVVPPQLRQLYLSGRAAAVASAVKQQPLDRLEVFRCEGRVSSVTSLARALGRMPRLRELRVDGQYDPHDLNDFDSESDSGWDGNSVVCWTDMRVLAAAVGAATQLTSLVVEGFKSDYVGYEGVWAEHLTRLKSLQYLDLGFELSGTDVAAVALLKQLTFLRLSRCGRSVGSEELQVLCSSLSQLRALTFERSYVCDCDALFGAVAQLTQLSALSLDENNDIYTCDPSQLELLWPLVQLQTLVLPPALPDDVNADESIAALFEHIPALTSVRVCEESYGPR